MATALHSSHKGLRLGGESGHAAQLLPRTSLRGRGRQDYSLDDSLRQCHLQGHVRGHSRGHSMMPPQPPASSAAVTQCKARTTQQREKGLAFSASRRGGETVGGPRDSLRSQASKRALVHGTGQEGECRVRVGLLGWHHMPSRGGSIPRHGGCVVLSRAFQKRQRARLSLTRWTCRRAKGPL